jgi:hypothetical protein
MSVNNRRTVAVLILSIMLCMGFVAKADDAPAKTSFGDFEFVIPAKWSRITPDRPKTKAMLLLNGTAPNDCDAMIKVDAGKPAKPTAKELAAALAGPGGKVYPDPVQIDGEEGFKVETSSTDMTQPKFAIVVFHANKAYLIMGAKKQGVENNTLSEAIDQIAKSWKWKKTE